MRRHLYACLTALVLSTACPVVALASTDIAGLGSTAAEDLLKSTGVDIVNAILAQDSVAMGALMSDFALKHATPDELLDAARGMRLHEMTTLAFTRIQSHGNTASVRADFRRVDGAERTLYLGLLLDDTTWKLRMLGVENPAVLSDPALLSLPPPDEIEPLLVPVLSAFLKGHESGTFEALYSMMGSDMHDNMTLIQFNEGLASIGKRRHWADASALSAELDEAPRIAERGVLELHGRYPTKPPIRFRYGFVHESGEWRLLRFEFDHK